MSAKTRRGATPAKQPTPQPTARPSRQTPSQSRDEQPGRPGSPLSPTIMSRREEKTELTNLNDKLAHYIEVVRRLESDKASLQYSLQTIEESHTSEFKTFKNSSEKEVEEIRKALDRESSAKSGLVIEKRRLVDELIDLKNKLKDKTTECAAAENKVARLEAMLNDANHQLNQEKTKSSQLAEEKKKLTNENKRIPILEMQLQEQRKNIDEEQLRKVELENENQSLREQLSYQIDSYETRIQEVQKKRTVELSEVDSRLNRDYETRLAEQLQLNRALFDEEFIKHKQELVKSYQNQLNNQEHIIEGLRKEQSSLLLEIKEIKGKSGKFDTEMSELRAANFRLTERSKELQDQLDYEQSKFSRMETEIKRLQSEMSEQLKDYRELMEIKINLDSEISQYRNLMESEESRLRLNLSSAGSLSSPYLGGTPTRVAGPSKKRKLNVVEEFEQTGVSNSEYQVSSSAQGNIEITEVDPDGKYIKLRNKGTEEQALGNWQIIRKIKGETKTTFKFHRTLKIEGGGIVTVWSFQAEGASHEPPHNIIMKNQQFVSGSEMSTVLLNTDGEEMAIVEHKQETTTSSRIRQVTSEGFQRSSSSFLRTSREDYHPSVERHVPGEDERCSIM